MFLSYPLSFDSRGSVQLHWSNDSLLQGRAAFRASHTNAYLQLDDLRRADDGVYRCRVDYTHAQTTTTTVVLRVVGKRLSLTEGIYIAIVE